MAFAIQFLENSSPSPTPEAATKVKLKVMAAVIRGDGTIIPVARTEFTFDPISACD